jgi:hypothetical protein
VSQHASHYHWGPNNAARALLLTSHWAQFSGNVCSICAIRRLVCICPRSVPALLPRFLFLRTIFVFHLYVKMKDLVSILLLCVATVVVGDVVKVKRQLASSSSAVADSSSSAVEASSSTSSVFSIPTPTTLPTVNSSEYDLSKHFCRIWRHESELAEVNCKSCCSANDLLQVCMPMVRSILTAVIR